MKRFLYLFIMLFLFATVLPVKAQDNYAHIAPLVPKKTQLEKRQIQTKVFDCNEQPLVMKAILNVLQDEGYIVNNANPILGFISGAKEFDVGDPSIDIEKEFGVSRRTLARNGIKVAVIESTANVTEYGDQTKVRITFKRKLLNMYGNAQVISEINDERYYREFFTKVDKAVFIQKQKI